MYLDALARLQDHVETVPSEQIEEAVTTEVGSWSTATFTPTRIPGT